MPAPDVTFDSSGCALAGPYAEGVSPVAGGLLIVGSGKTGRDSDVHLPLHQLLRGGITRQVLDALAAAVPGGLSHLLRPDPESPGPRGYRRATHQPAGREVLDLIIARVQGRWPAPDRLHPEPAAEDS